MELQLTACSFELKCGGKWGDETEIYEDGYSKKHYYKNVGDNLKDDIAGLFE